MSTNFQGVYTGFSISNLNQIKAYTEGGPDLSLDPLDLTTGANYSRVYTITFTIVSANYANIQILQASGSGPQLQQSGATYTLTSTYNSSMGLLMNNWAYFKLALRGLSLHFKNSDWGETFNINVSITDGTTTTNDTIQIIVTPDPDASGIPATKSGLPKAFNVRTLADMGLSSIQIIDPAAATKTYRLTFTVNDSTNGSGSSNGYIWLYDTANSVSLPFQKTCTISGTAAYLNSVLSGVLVPSYTLGIGFANFSGNFYGQWTVSYTQEVLTTAEVGVSVPYVQETGTLTFNQDNSGVFTPHASFNYTEDVTPATFSLGTLIDQAGQQWPGDTTVTTGLNSYTVTATIQESFPGTNPAYLTYSGDGSVDNTVTYTGTFANVNSVAAVQAVQLIPPADYTGTLTIGITISRGNGFGGSGVIYTGSIVATCNSTHNEFTIIGGGGFAIGTNALNIGSITDTAVSKNYTVTIEMGLSSTGGYGALADTTGTGTWNATGGTSGNGLLTISGNKTVVNASLAALTYTTGISSALTDVLILTYTQSQTTNSLAQGSTTLTMSNAYIWGSGNTGTGFVFDEDTKITYNLGNILATIGGTAKATMTLSTGFSTANGGSVTGWTKISDTVWEFSGTKAAVNAALAATELVPPADRVTAFTMDMQIYDGVTLKYDSAAYSTTKTFNIRTTHSEFSVVSPIVELPGGNSAAYNIGSITDLRPDNISSAITYSVTLTPASLTEITSLSSAGSGGTSTWSAGVLTLTGTKTQVNSHLATVTLNYAGNNNTSIAYSQTQTTNSVSQGSTTITVNKPAQQFLFNSAGFSARTSDLISFDVDALPNTAGFGTNPMFPTFTNNKWVLTNPFMSGSPNANTAQINQSTATSWTTSSFTTGISVPTSDGDYGFSGGAAGAGSRIFVFTDGPSGGGPNQISLSYTTNDSSYTNVLLDLTPGTLGSQSSPGNVGVSYKNGRYHVTYVSRINHVKVATSTNGTSWSYSNLVTASAAPALYPEITYQNSRWTFVGFIDQLKFGYSTGGTSWTLNTITASASRASSGAYWNGSYWIVLGYLTSDSLLRAFKSSDGVTWTNTSLGIAQSSTLANCSSLAYGNSTWLLKNGNAIYTSPDGVTWTARSFGYTPYAVYNVKFINSHFYALVSQTNNNSRLYESADGITWTLKYSFASGYNWTEISVSS